MAEPEEHRAARPRAKRLLSCPQCVLAIGRTHDEAALEGNARLGKRRRIRQVRRIHPTDHAIAFACANERAGKKSDFADPHPVVQHFRQGSGGPASAGQLAIERGMSGRNRGLSRMLELPAAPNAGKPGELGDRDFHPRALRLRITPTATPSIDSVSRCRSR